MSYTVYVNGEFRLDRHLDSETEALLRATNRGSNVNVGELIPPEKRPRERLG